MNDPQIIGSVLVKNEDRFIERIILNILEFCDRIVVTDNDSTDNTYNILLRLSREYPKIDLHRIPDARQSHDFLRGFAQSNCWVFGVDGDELYDPEGLIELRRQLFAGVYDKWWVLFGNVLNCIKVDEEKKTASGYLAPPCRSMTKLYNFRILKDWSGSCGHRLSGGITDFIPGYNATLRNDLYKRISWEESFFRCLHICFTKRSSLDTIQEGYGFARENVTELQNRSPRQRLRALFLKCLCRQPQSRWKHEKYARGSLITKDVSTFFP